MSTAAAAGVRRPWLVLAVTAVGSFMAILDVFIVNVGIPSIRGSLGASPGEIEFVITAYSMTYAVLLITGGRLGDIVGRRQMFLGGMATFTLGSALCGAAPTAGVLIGARVVQAAGAAMMTPQVISMVQLTFGGRERARALALLSAMNGLAAITAQIGGGLLIQANLFGLGWRVVFLVNLPIGAVALVAAALVQPRQAPRHTARLDVPGAALLMLTLVLVLVPLVEGRDAGWPPWMLALLLLVPGAAATFLVYERRRARRGASPLLSFSLFRERSFSAGLGILFCIGMGNSSLFFTMTLYLQAGLGFSPGRAGLTFLSLGIGYMVGSSLAPRVLRLLGRRALTVAYLTIATGTAGLLAVINTAAAPPTPLLLALPLVVISLGQGLGTSSLFGIILSRGRPGDAGSASGVMTTTMQLGGAMGVAVVGLVFFSVLGGAAAQGSLSGFTRAFSTSLCVGIVLALLATAASSFLPRGATAFASERQPGLAVLPAEVAG